MISLILVTVLPALGAKGKNRSKSRKKSHTPLVVPVCAQATYQRNWEKAPAVVTIKDPTRTLYAISDVHGESNDAFDLVLNAKIVSGNVQNFKWIAGNGVLVVAGDSINKGMSSVAVIDLWMKLEKEAQLAGGSVYVLAGNHEIAFLANPSHKLFRSIHTEMIASGMDLCKDLYAPESPYGAWLRDRPAAVLVNGVFINHSGNTNNLSLAEIDAAYREMVDAGQWDSVFACGTASNGFFNKTHFWLDEKRKVDESLVDKELAAVGAKQILFGHDPDAFGSRYEMIGYFGNTNGRAVIKLDMVLVRAESRGSLYKCSDFLPDSGGCRSPQVMINPIAGTAADLARLEPLKVNDTPPKRHGAIVEKGDWCIGSGHQKP